MSIYELTTSGSSALAVRPCTELKLADGRPMLLCIPDGETSEYLRDVSEEERSRIEAIWEAFRIMASARNLKAGAAAAAMLHQHDGRGWSAKTLLDLFRAYQSGGHKPGDFRKQGPKFRAGDWRILLRDYSGRKAVLPEEFVRFVVEQWAQFRGRSDCIRALWRHIVQELWLKGQPIPGYGTIDEWCKATGRARPHPLMVRPGELPEGWSESTFRRALPTRKSTKRQVAGGYLPAHTYQPDQVLTDRSELMPLQYVFLDDTRPDFRCLHFAGGRGEFVYPLLVLGLDAATGVDVANVAKPRALKSPDAEDALERKARHGVTHDMALLVVLNVLRRFGLPPYPITFVHENAAACVPPEAKRILKDAFGDRIRFEATSTFKGRMMRYGFTEHGGAPYDKAPIEVFFRVLMTQMARTPMSTGPRYDTAPSENASTERYTLALLNKAGSIESIVKRLQLPALDFHQAHQAIEDALRLLRFRTNHKLQGFERVREWRKSQADEYRPIEELLHLPSEEQAQVSDIIERLECPAERFVRLLQGVQFTAVDEDLLTYLAGERRKVTVRNGKISIMEQSLGNDQLIYREENNPLLDVEAEGRTYQGVLSADGSRIVLGDSDGRILGGIYQQGRVSRADKEALHREQGRVRAARAADRDAFAGYALGNTNEALMRLRQHNAQVLVSGALPEGTSSASPAIATPEVRVSTKQLTATDLLLSREGRNSENDES